MFKEQIDTINTEAATLFSNALSTTIRENKLKHLLVSRFDKDSLTLLKDIANGNFVCVAKIDYFGAYQSLKGFFDLSIKKDEKKLENLFKYFSVYLFEIKLITTKESLKFLVVKDADGEFGLNIFEEKVILGEDDTLFEVKEEDLEFLKDTLEKQVEGKSLFNEIKTNLNKDNEFMISITEKLRHELPILQDKTKRNLECHLSNTLLKDGISEVKCIKNGYVELKMRNNNTFDVSLNEFETLITKN